MKATRLATGSGIRLAGGMGHVGPLMTAHQRAARPGLAIIGAIHSMIAASCPDVAVSSQQSGGLRCASLA